MLNQVADTAVLVQAWLQGATGGTSPLSGPSPPAAVAQTPSSGRDKRAFGLHPQQRRARLTLGTTHPAGQSWVSPQQPHAYFVSLADVLGALRDTATAYWVSPVPQGTSPALSAISH